jgi:hypothetical protein
VRETITRLVSRAGIPTNRKPTRRASEEDSALWAAFATRAAMANPSGRLPPSPRKIRAGELRL